MSILPYGKNKKKYLRLVDPVCGTVITLLGLVEGGGGWRSWLLCFSLVYSMCAVCHGFYGLPLGAIDYVL